MLRISLNANASLLSLLCDMIQPVEGEPTLLILTSDRTRIKEILTGLAVGAAVLVDTQRKEILGIGPPGLVIYLSQRYVVN